MSRLQIPFDTWVLVADGRKALLLRNATDEVRPDLKVLKVIEQPDNPKTAEHGTDRPGRRADKGPNQRSAMEQTDFHDLAEKDFAAEVAGEIERHHRDGDFRKLIVVAPARTLAEFRNRFSKEVHATVLAELDKDLTKHPVHEIERVLTQT
ncbi:MAG: host attachment protein [Alphaproteobacteria bacterium]|nr:host attachment protein [Alphaproteobacteria bacterium]MCW5740587.1 host attachment protein [Alphaproteobacteria bacterium]